MRLRRIEVTDFRKFRHTVVEGLGDGLNVVVGDNEAGKSTLLSALRAAFFERHRVGGRVAEEMQPFGQSLRPEILVEFDLGGASYRLRKAFCKKPEAHLTGPDGAVSGDEVEERLAGLLGFAPPGAGGSKPEQHQGAHGLLWVRQGAAHQSLGIGAGRDAIAAALEAEVGQVLGGERGRALVDAAEQRWSSFWDKRGNPRGDWRKMLDEAAELEARRMDLDGRLAAYADKVAQLEACRAALARHAEENSLARAVRVLAGIREETVAAGRLEQGLRDAAMERRLAEAAHASARERQAARTALDAKVVKAAKERAAAEARWEEERTHRARRRVAADEARDRTEAAVRRKGEADAKFAVAQQSAERRRALADLSRLEAQLARAAAADEHRRTAEVRARACPVTKSALGNLERLQATLDQARAASRIAAVEIDFRPGDGRTVSIGQATHPPHAPLRLTRVTEIDLEGFGAIVVRPGGDADARSRAESMALEALLAALRPLGVDDLEAARSAWAKAEDDRAAAGAQAQVVAGLAPDGLDALRTLVESRRAMNASSDEEADVIDPDAAQAERDAAAAAVASAETVERQALAACADAATAATRAEAQAQAQARSHDVVAADLGQARLALADDRLAQDLSTAEAALGVATRAEADARAMLEAADLDVLRLRLRKAEGAELAIRDDIAQQRRSAELLEAELSALGRDGLGEQLAEVEGQLDLVRRRLAVGNHEAAAARLLHETLGEAQSASKERWLGPVKARVAPYLRLLAPDGEVVLDEETLELRGVRRQGLHEPFDALSVGAREQMAVITRLALADLLRSAGRPSAVILDDALVNTDETRLERMHLALHRAAETLQVLVLTCRERDFRQLGAPVIRMA